MSLLGHKIEGQTLQLVANKKNWIQKPQQDLALDPFFLTKKSCFFYFFFFFTLSTLFPSCGLVQTKPKLELSLAEAAFVAAREQNAHIKAPGLFRKAEIYYLKARSSYRKKYFSKAKQYALLSREFSEQAEFAAIKKSLLESE